MGLIDKIIKELKSSKAVECEDDFTLVPTFNGYLASNYYILHKSIHTLSSKLQAGLGIYDLIQILSSCEEYKEVPVRHNEDNLNEALANICPYPVDRSRLGDPKTKTILLFQAYFGQLPLPIRDYITDTKLVLDNCIRFIQAMIDIAAEESYLDTLLNLAQLNQMITQGCWMDQSSFFNLPGLEENGIEKLKNEGIQHLCQLIEIYNNDMLDKFFKAVKINISVSSIFLIFRMMK